MRHLKSRVIMMPTMSSFAVVMVAVPPDGEVGTITTIWLSVKFHCNIKTISEGGGCYGAADPAPICTRGICISHADHMALYLLRCIVEIFSVAGLLKRALWPSDAIWRYGSRSTLVQVMACCLTAPSHYLIQYWLITIKVQWCSSEGNFTWDIKAISH